MSAWEDDAPEFADQIALPTPSEPQPATRCPQCGKDHAAGVVCSACGTVINVDGECGCDTAGWVNGQPVRATPPAAAEPHRCSGCNHRWDGPLKGAELCGDCWRRVQPELHGPAMNWWQCVGERTAHKPIRFRTSDYAVCPLCALDAAREEGQ